MCTRRRKMCQMVILLTSGILLLVIICAQVSSVILQEEEDLSNRVTLKTLDAGTFIGQRVPDKFKEKEENALPRSYFAFRGIPYAQPPQRWGAPEPPQLIKKRQPQVATKYKPMCSQWDEMRGQVVGSQDCLYLNIFTPYVPSTARKPMPPLQENMTSWTIENKNLLPVLVHVHGGEFLGGGGHLYSPENFMKQGNVVLVTFNYRLGLLGFLTNGEESMAGNYGILDQLEALRWLKENIYRFGGNPLRICIFGSVDHLLLRGERGEGLFQSAILSPHSTSSLFAPLLHSLGSPKDFFQMVGREAGCSMRDDEKIQECLRVTHPDSLIRVQHRLLKFFSVPHYPGLHPVSDKWEEFPLIPDDPQVLIQQGNFISTIPLMIGISAFEGFNPFFEFYLKLGPIRKDILKEKEFLMEKLESTLKTLLNFSPSESSFEEFHRIFLSIWRNYFGSLEKGQWELLDPDRILWKLFRIFGDLMVNSSQRKLTQLLISNNKAPVYNYIFNSSIYKFSNYLEERLETYGNHSTKKMSLHSASIPPWKELHYLFQEPLDPKDIDLSDFLIKIYISFAKHGNPKVNHWGRAGEGNFNYFVIGNESSYPLSGEFRKSESKFWLSILPQIRDLSGKITDLEGYPTLFWVFVGLTAFLVFVSILLILFICCGRDKGKLKYYM